MVSIEDDDMLAYVEDGCLVKRAVERGKTVRIYSNPTSAKYIQAETHVRRSTYAQMPQ